MVPWQRCQDQDRKLLRLFRQSRWVYRMSPASGPWLTYFPSEAQAYGLVNRVVDAGTALDGARDLAAEILDGSPTSVRISLQVMDETRGIADVVDAVTHPTSAFDDLMTSEDAIEGMTAFAQNGNFCMETRKINSGIAELTR